MKITNQATGLIIGVNDAVKSSGQLLFGNKGTVSSATGQVVDLGSSNTSLESSVINSGMVTSQKGQAISLGSGGDTVVLQNGSVIEGEILGGAGHDIIRVDFGDGNTFGFSDKISGVEEISVESGKMAFLDGAELVVSVNADGTSGTAVGDIEFETGAMLTLVATDFDPAEMLSGKSCRIFSSEVNFNGDIRIEGIAQTFAWTVINGVVTVGVPEPALCAALLGALALGLAARRRSGK